MYSCLTFIEQNIICLIVAIKTDFLTRVNANKHSVIDFILYIYNCTHVLKLSTMYNNNYYHFQHESDHYSLLVHILQYL